MLLACMASGWLQVDADESHPHADREACSLAVMHQWLGTELHQFTHDPALAFIDIQEAGRAVKGGLARRLP